MPSETAGPERPLIDIRHNIYLAQEFVKEFNYDAFRGNELVFYAVTRCLEIISEASRRLPEDLKARHPHIPWGRMAGAGNVYRHDDEDVRHYLIWGTVKDRLQELLVAVEKELGRL